MAELVQPEQYPFSISAVPKAVQAAVEQNKKVPEENTGKISLLRPVSSVKCKNIAIASSASTMALQKSSSLWRMGGLHHLSPQHCRAQQLPLHMLWHAAAASDVPSSGSEWADASK